MGSNAVSLSEGKLISQAAKDTYNMEVTKFLTVMSVKANVVLTPKSCPDCGPLGFCQLTTGKCMCQSITTGLAEDCPAFNVTNGDGGDTAPTAGPTAAPTAAPTA